jgi:hypothetical protein
MALDILRSLIDKAELDHQPNQPTVLQLSGERFLEQIVVARHSKPEQTYKNVNR